MKGQSRIWGVKKPDYFHIQLFTKGNTCFPDMLFPEILVFSTLNFFFFFFVVIQITLKSFKTQQNTPQLTKKSANKQKNTKTQTKPPPTKQKQQMKKNMFCNFTSLDMWKKILYCVTLCQWKSASDVCKDNPI